VTALILCAVILVSCTKIVPSTPATAVPINTVSPIPAAATSQVPATGLENVIPRPVSVIPADGVFILSNKTGIYVDPGSDKAKAVGQYLADHINPATGFGTTVQATAGEPPKGSIYLTLTGADPKLGDEGYQLTITPDLVKVTANQPAGLFYGIQTIRQLLPASIDSSSAQPGPWAISAGTITDTPRFAWRGTMLDVARHFFSVRDVTRYIDLLAYYKINRLHLHLSDDQGWRIQIKKWPNLTIYGGSTAVGGAPGGFYSQDDYAYIVNYAQSRYITIVPEIDMPSHVNAALASYAELNCNGIAPELFTGTNVGFSTFCTSKDITYSFLTDVIGELAALTPGPYLHIGGDEAQSTSVADYIRFFNKVQAIVQANGKQVVGWEEIAQATLLPGSIVQRWNLGEGFAKQAVQQGAKVIMSPPDKAYMDMKYTPTTTLGLDWAGYVNVQTAYSWDPASMTYGINESNILGVEAPLWSETLITLNDIEYMAFPRILGYAEMGWSPQSDRDWNTYKFRLAAQGPRLDALGVNYYKSPEIVWP
jgi:hexosaminidase